MGRQKPEEGSAQHREGGVRMNFIEWLSNEYNLSLWEFYNLPDEEQARLEKEFKEALL